MTKVVISERQAGGNWVLAGNGELQGNQIVDCAADIGDEVYGALEGAIEYSTDTGRPVNGEYVRCVNGTDWRVQVTRDEVEIESK